VSRFADHLAAAGMSEREAAAKQRLFARAIKALSPIQTDAPLRAFYVPGRVEVLGKHTDYAGGRSLLGNVERGFCVIARERPRSGSRSRPGCCAPT
jgi:galactokinase